MVELEIGKYLRRHSRNLKKRGTTNINNREKYSINLALVVKPFKKKHSKNSSNADVDKFSDDVSKAITKTRASFCTLQF